MNVLVKWYRSTAKTYNAKWVPWAVGKKTAAKRSKRQKTEPAIWTSEIPVRDVVMAVEVTNEQGFVKIMSASIKRISEYTDHYEDGDDSDDDSEGLMWVCRSFLCCDVGKLVILVHSTQK